VLGLAYTDSPIIDDPQCSARVVIWERLKQAPRNVENRDLVLSGDSKHDDSWMRAGWVLPNVGEVRIKRHEYPILGFTDGRNFLIGSTTETLIFRRHCIVAQTRNKLGNLDREILIGLEPHVDLQAGRAMTRSRAKSAA